MKVLQVTSAAPKRSPFMTTEKLMPLGVGFLLAVLRQHGHEVNFIDNYLEPSGFPDNGYLEEHLVDFVGIYANTVCFQDTLRMIRRLGALRRRGKWDGKIMVGGPHVSVAPESLPSAVDFAVKGEGEQTILDIVEGRAQPGLIEGTKIAQLDALPRPAYDIFGRLPYQRRHMFEGKLPLFPMNTSRGCPFACTFCSVKAVWGRTYRYFSAERVFDDVCYLQRDFGAQTIYFREDHFTLNRERTLVFCELLLRHKHPIDWMCESRADSVDEEVIQCMAAAGCKVLYIGVESGSPRMLQFFKKNETLEDFESAFRLARQYGIKTYASFVVGAPTETEEELQMSLDFANRLQADWVGNNVFTGLPGSELYDYCLKNKEYSCIDANGLIYTKKHDEMVCCFYGPGAVWAFSPCRKVGAPQPEEYHMSVPVTTPSDQPVLAGQTDDAQRARAAVVITCYNLGAYLREAYDSACEQTLPDVEILIVDDGSTDPETQRVLAELASEEARVLHLENVGVARARNIGIRATSAPYIVCLDADDRLRPEYLACAVRVLDEDPQVGVVTPYYTTFGLTDEVYATDGIKLPELLVDNPVAVSAMFRRTAWEAVGGWCETMTGLQDWDLWISIVESGLRVHLIPEILFERRVREGSMLSTTRKPENYVRIMSQIYERHRATYMQYEDQFRAGRDKLYIETVNWASKLLQAVAWHQERGDETQAWIRELEQGKAWLEQQRVNWQSLAEEREQMIRELQAWIRELEQQGANWQRMAEEQEATICQQEAVIHRVDEYLTKFRLKPLIRLGKRLGFLRPDADEG